MKFSEIFSNSVHIPTTQVTRRTAKILGFCVLSLIMLWSQGLTYGKHLIIIYNFLHEYADDDPNIFFFFHGIEFITTYKNTNHLFCILNIKYLLKENV